MDTGPEERFLPACRAADVRKARVPCSATGAITCEAGAGKVITENG